VDPSQSIISLSSDNEPFPTEKTLTTVTFTTKTSHVPAKTCPLNKLTRKSLRNAKQHILAPKDKPSSNSQASTISSPQLISRKRQNTTTLESNTHKKKGPSSVKEIEVPPDTPPSTPLVFNPGSFEKAPSRAIFKATRKGKRKMVSNFSTSVLDSTSKRGFVKPSQQQ
jgi:hypothetical protein